MSATTVEEELSEDEREGLELVRETGGIYQSDFWKELDISSRKGSRIVESLAEKGLVEREESTYQGNRTYHISPRPRDLDFSLLMAGDLLSPFVGEDDVDPQDDAFSQWIMSLAFED